MDQDKEFVICVTVDRPHTPEAVIRHCDRCFADVWCRPVNLTMTPLCMPCAFLLTAGDPEARFAIRAEDLPLLAHLMNKKKG